MVCVKLGKRHVGLSQPCYIVFEGGGTHSGLEVAKQLVKVAVDSGADAVKFQFVDSDRLYHNKNIQIKYSTPTGDKVGNRYEMSKKRMMSIDEWKELIAYCKELNITFFSTACFPQDVDFLVEQGAAAIKINAGDSNHYYLIDYASRKGVPIILDGRARYDELAKGVEICEYNGNKDIIIMHCPPGYPAKNSQVNLNVIRTLTEIYRYPIGFCDHSLGKIMNYPAIILGACILEKTITLDKRTESIEHYMSLEPSEAKEFIKDIRAIEESLGSGREIFNSRVGVNGKRSIVAKRDIRQGEALRLEDLNFKRPGTHLSASRYLEVIGKIAKRDLKENEFIMFNDLEDNEIKNEFNKF